MLYPKGGEGDWEPGVGDEGIGDKGQSLPVRSVDRRTCWAGTGLTAPPPVACTLAFAETLELTPTLFQNFGCSDKAINPGDFRVNLTRS